MQFVVSIISSKKKDKLRSFYDNRLLKVSKCLLLMEMTDGIGLLYKLCKKGERKPGDKKGERKPGDKKGERKPGDKKGERKPGDKKGERKPGDKKGKRKQPGDKKE
ncbi:hypothetical protein [Gottfriedia acidiceleris]|uniref:hypothetical protein n=1 Tax=Gottfriedia acidiceleris TaxID=371036 RepID=UPI003D1C21D8